MVLKKMNHEETCQLCKKQEIINDNYKRNIDGELITLCPICFKSHGYK